jgi:hypothetical protein
MYPIWTERREPGTHSVTMQHGDRLHVQSTACAAEATGKGRMARSEAIGKNSSNIQIECFRHSVAKEAEATFTMALP